MFHFQQAFLSYLRNNKRRCFVYFLLPPSISIHMNNATRGPVLCDPEMYLYYFCLFLSPAYFSPFTVSYFDTRHARQHPFIVFELCFIHILLVHIKKCQRNSFVFYVFKEVTLNYCVPFFLKCLFVPSFP